VNFLDKFFKTSKTSEPEKKSYNALWFLKDTNSEYLTSKINKPYSSITYVYACVNAIAKSLSKLPFRLYDSYTKQVIEKGRVYDAFSYVNPLMSRYQLWESLAIFLTLSGECIIILDKYIDNIPTEFWIFNPSRFLYKLNNDGKSIALWEYNNGATKIQFTPDEIIYFKKLNPYHDIRGLAGIDVLSSVIQNEIYANNFNNSFFKNGLGLGTVLRTEKSLTQTQIARLKEYFSTKNNSISKAHKVAILEGGLSLEQSVNQRDAEFINSRKMNREEICSVFGVPPALVGIYEYANYANAEAQRKIFYEDTIIPLTKYIEDKFKTDFFDRFRIKLYGEFDFSEVEVLKENLKEKIDMAKTLFYMGVPLKAINEKLNLGFNVDEIPGSDEAYLPGNMIPIGAASQQEEKKFIQDKKYIESDFRTSYWKKYVNEMSIIENSFAKKLKLFFYDLRKETLSNISNFISKGIKKDIYADADAVIGEIIFDVSKAKEKVSVISLPFFEEGLKRGIKQISRDLKVSEFNYNSNEKLMKFLEKKQTKIKEVITTVDKDIRKRLKTVIDETIAEAYKNGDVLSVAEALAVSADKITAETKHTFNIAGNRSLTIARTEVAQAVSTARHESMKVNNIEKQEWITARDESVREWHADMDGEVVLVDKTFSNGLLYPNDPSGPAEEVINCRCVSVPIIES